MYFQKNKEFNDLLPHVFRTFHVLAVPLLLLTQVTLPFCFLTLLFRILTLPFGIFNSFTYISTLLSCYF